MERTKIYPHSPLPLAVVARMRTWYSCHPKKKERGTEQLLSQPEVCSRTGLLLLDATVTAAASTNPLPSSLPPFSFASPPIPPLSPSLNPERKNTRCRQVGGEGERGRERGGKRPVALSSRKTRGSRAPQYCWEVGLMESKRAPRLET
jgi:hypothetical protein